MLRLTNLANKYQRRTLRALYAQTQAYPYDARLISNFDRSAANFGLGNATAAIIPGCVAVKNIGETVDLSGAYPSSRAFGLFANYVGGELSDIPSDFDRVGIWRGAGGVFQLLAPAFDDTGLAALAAAEDGAPANEVYLRSNASGVLAAVTNANGWPGLITSATKQLAVARLMRRLSANSIIVELLV